MSKNIGSVNFKLVSQYDNAGVKLAMKDMDASQKMIAGMSSASAGKTDPMMAKLGTWNADQLKAAEALKQADRDYWTQRARLRDQNLARELEAEKQLERERRLAAMSLRDQKAQALRDLQSPSGIAVAGQAATGSRGGGAMAISQFGFMMQDFQSQMVNSKNLTDGLGRGIMAISNNVQMLGASFGPTGMAVSAIGGALAGIVLPQVIRWISKTEDLEKITAQVKSDVESMANLSRNVIEIRVRGGAFGKSESLKDDKETAQGQFDFLAKKTAEYEQGVRDSERRIRELRKTARESDLPTDNQAQRNRNQELRNELQSQTRSKAMAAEFAASRDKEALKKNEADFQIKRLRSQADFEHEMSLKDQIAKFNAEENSKTVTKEDEKLREKKSSLDEEMAFLKEKLETASDEEKQWLNRELEDRQKAYADNERVIAATRDKVRKSQIESEVEEQRKAFEKAGKHELDTQKKQYDKDILDENKKQFQLSEQKDALEGRGVASPNGSSPASVRGTGAATSAINRALAGTRSEENDRKHQIKILEELLKSSQKMEQKLRFVKAELRA